MKLNILIRFVGREECGKNVSIIGVIKDFSKKK